MNTLLSWVWTGARLATSAKGHVPFAIMLFIIVMMQPQLSWGALRCSDLGFDPVIEGERILERYYVASDGIGGLGCWVHPHPNGMDYVITPHSWGEDPNHEHLGLIKDALQSFSDSRDAMGALGTLNSGLFMLLKDAGREGGYARWILNDECWITADHWIGFGRARAFREHFKSYVAHEVGHCFLMENIPGYTPETEGVSEWWDESGADFLMALVYPADNAEHANIIRFDLDGIDFTQKYRASVFLQHYANTSAGGNNAVLPLLTQFHAASADFQTLNAFLARSGLDKPFHDFNRTHYIFRVSDPGGGYQPRETDVSSVLTTFLAQDQGFIELGSVTPRRLNLVQAELPAGYDVRLHNSEDIGVLYEASVYDSGVFHDDWSNKINIAGECGHEKRISIIFTSLAVDPPQDIRIPYVSTKIETCNCQDEALFDGCLVGTWKMDTDSMSAFIGSDPDQPPTGDVMLRFLPGGAFTVNYDQVDSINVFYDRFGEFKSRHETFYRGAIRGCARSYDAKRLDGAAPLKASDIVDNVRREMYDKTSSGFESRTKEAGLQAWHWPHSPGFYRCDAARLSIGSRVYERRGGGTENDSP